MTRIELDILDWRTTTHLPASLWLRFAGGELEPAEDDVLERHLMVCPCCQEQLLEVQSARAALLRPACAPQEYGQAAWIPAMASGSEARS